MRAGIAAEKKRAAEAAQSREETMAAPHHPGYRQWKVDAPIHHAVQPVN